MYRFVCQKSDFPRKLNFQSSQLREVSLSSTLGRAEMNTSRAVDMSCTEVAYSAHAGGKMYTSS